MACLRMAGLKEFKVARVLRAEHFDRARDYYKDVLGLDVMAAPGPTREGLFLAGDGTALQIYERPGMPAPQNATLAFAVPADRFDAVMAELKGKGVKFEDHDIPEIGLMTMDGVADYDGSKVAWFLDSEGNIVSLGTM